MKMGKLGHGRLQSFKSELNFNLRSWKQGSIDDEETQAYYIERRMRWSEEKSLMGLKGRKAADSRVINKHGSSQVQRKIQGCW